MSYRGYNNKAPASTTRTSTNNNTFRSTFSPLSTTANSNNSSANSNNASNRYGTAASRSTYSAAEETPVKRQAATTESSPSSKPYQSSINGPPHGQNRETSMNTSVGSASRIESGKSAYGGAPASRTTDIGKASASDHPSPAGASSSYSLGRGSNYASLYKLPSRSPGKTQSSTAYGSNSWADRNTGRSGGGGVDVPAISKPSAAGSRGTAMTAPSAVSESNLLTPGSYMSRYSRSKSREKETDPVKSEASAKNDVATVSSTLPRSFRSYNHRSVTNTTFQSPSTYTPRIPVTYSRAIYSSALPSSSKHSAERPFRSLLQNDTTNSSLPVPTQVQETKDSEESSSESGSESDSSGEEEKGVNETAAEDYVISRGTSPSPSNNESVPSGHHPTPTASISGSIRTPKSIPSRIPTVTVREVQTEDLDPSIRPRRFLSGCTGSPSAYGSAGSTSLRSGTSTGRYYSVGGKSPPAEEKTSRSKSKDPSSTGGGTLHKPPIPAGIGSKEYRKSALNVDLDDQQVSEFRRRQEEYREAQRRAKRQARKNSSGGSASSSASSAPIERKTTPAVSRRNSSASNSDKGRLSSSRSGSIPEQPVVIRSQSRRSIVPSVKNSGSSRSSSCSSSSSAEADERPSPETSSSRIKTSSSGIGENVLPVRTSLRKNSTSSESVNRLKISSRHSTDRSIASASPPRRSPSLPASTPVSQSRSPSVTQDHLVRSSSSSHRVAQKQQQQQQSDSSLSQSRSSSVNWSKLLKMTRGPDERSSTSPESLASKSSSSSRGNNRPAANASRSPSYNRMLIRNDSGNGRPLKAPSSSSSLPPAGLPANRSGRTTASSSRSHIPSRNASVRSIARSCSTSTDSSTSTESDPHVPHSRSVSRIKDSASASTSSKRNSLEPSSGGGGGESSFAAKLASSFGWLRKQNSDIIPWWLPSTDNVPAKEQEEGEEEEEEEGRDLIKATEPDSSSTSSADETQSSSSADEDETESADNKQRDDTDVEIDDLPAEDFGVTKPETSDPAGLDGEKPEVELGDRSSPDGFEWPDCPVTPPLIRSYPFYSRRPASPYDNVVSDRSSPVVPVVQQPSPSGCSMNTAWGLDALRALESLETMSSQQAKQLVLSDGHEVEDDDQEEEDEEGDGCLQEVIESKMEKFEGINKIQDQKDATDDEDEDEDEDEEEDDEEDNEEKLEQEKIVENEGEEEELSDDSSDEEEEGDRDHLEQQSKRLEASSSVLLDSASSAAPTQEKQLEDATFQVYKDGDYGNYLDVEATLNEQAEELEGFLENRKNSIVLRTQLSVRVHGIMDKLLHSEGRELRRALFSLKQIFQEDKDLVHEFVQNEGLACLIRVGQNADQNFQNYILRALGQVMLYVDGMNGIMEHNPTVQWLYSLIASKYRLVAKTALKLLLVFVEYIETNCQLLVKAVEAVDAGQDLKPWTSLMRLLQERDSSDSELLVYAVTLINKTLHGLLDQDSYYDQIEFIEALGMQQITIRFMSRTGTDPELLQQFEIYELELKQEDGDSPFKEQRRTPRNWHSNRKSPRHSSYHSQQGNIRLNSFQMLPNVSNDMKIREDGVQSTGEQGVIMRKLTASQSKKHLALLANELADKSFNQWNSSSSDSSCSMEDVKQNMLNGTHADLKGVNDVGVTPALRRRRERAERQRSWMREQEEASRISPSQGEELLDDSSSSNLPKVNVVADVADENRRNTDLTMTMHPPLSERISNLQKEKDKDSIDRNLLDISREASVKDLTERLQANHISANPTSPTEEKCNRLGDLSGIISKAKEELTKSKSRHDLRNLTEQNGIASNGKAESKKSENELHWESLLETLDRPLQICDLDFTDLQQEEDSDPLNPSGRNSSFGPPPPPPPPQLNGLPPPPMPGLMMPPPPPPSSRSIVSPNTFFGVQLHHKGPELPVSNSNTLKNKKTVKLFWREIREDQLSLIKGPTLWDELKPVTVDTLKLEHLFESRSKDLMTKKQQEATKNKELIVLDPKRSNSINIGMTKLPPPRTIKTAILKMDSTIINREGIEKLLTMLPSDEERAKIQEAQLANPELPLGSAEQFLLSLASITELAARLKLWLFKSDYENMEKELAEPLMDLKQGIEILQSNVTFRTILATLLAVGSFLNGAETKGFQVDYLAKVPEVKDTVHKHSLLHHLCHMVMEQNLETTDLYSEIGAVTRASRVDYDELAANLNKMEEDCKASWDHLRAIAKHDGNTTMKIKMSEFLTDCAERIMVASIVHRRVMNRFRKFLLWLGTPPAQVRETKPGSFCRVVSEFALEYRTTRDRVLQQMEKKANHRERSKTRGKMITQIGNGFNSTSSYEPLSYRSKEDRADAELRQLLGSDISDTESMRTGTWGRSRKSVGLGRSTSIRDDYLTDTVTDGDDEILESLVKTATRTPTTHPRERKRSNRPHAHADRSELRRTRKNGLSEEDRNYLITLAAQVAAA